VLAVVEFDGVANLGQVRLQGAGFGVGRRRPELGHHDRGQNAENDDHDEQFDQGEPGLTRTLWSTLSGLHDGEPPLFKFRWVLVHDVRPLALSFRPRFADL